MIPALHPSSGPHTSGPDSAYYYCCSCQYGPMLLALHAACINCGHQGCSKCNAEAAEGASKLATIPTTPEPGSTTLADASLKTSDEITRPHSTAPLATFCGGGLVVTNITTDIHGLTSCEKPTEGEYDWYCCNCGDGPQYVGVNPGCTTCSHWRCSSCAIEPRK